jgi:SAM-dependent methyltransferase
MADESQPEACVADRPAAAAAADAAEKARAFFDDLWRRGDYWNLEGSAFEQAKYARQLQCIGGRRYGKVLEIGCGGGSFTRMLGRVADRIVAIDVSPAAIDRAGSCGDEAGKIDYRVADVMDFDPAADGPFDLVVMSETIYYLGWLYPLFDLAWLAGRLFDATSDGGRLLMTNTAGGAKGYLQKPWILETYRDLFRNVGYRLESQEPFTGAKDGSPLEASICLFARPAGSQNVTT